MNKKYMDFVPVGAKKPVKAKNSVKKIPEKAKSANKVTTPLVKTENSNIKEIKAKKISTRRVTGVVEKPVEKPKKVSTVKNSFNVPNPQFINQEKISKRPLSKNVYQKKIEEFKEEPKGPVTIISKPEKDSKVGLIVTIILTIILGAAAGTVAFLLLPK